MWRLRRDAQRQRDEISRASVVSSGEMRCRVLQQQQFVCGKLNRFRGWVFNFHGRKNSRDGSGGLGRRMSGGRREWANEWISSGIWRVKLFF